MLPFAKNPIMYEDVTSTKLIVINKRMRNAKLLPGISLIYLNAQIYPFSNVGYSFNFRLFLFWW